MPRPTLKLPAKVPTSDAPGDGRSPARKPVRAGFTAAKQTAAQRAASIAARALRPRSDTPAEAPQPRQPERSKPPAAGKAPADRAAEAPRSYPKRGIARSAGARALPPTRSNNERATPERRVPPVPPAAQLPPVAAPMPAPAAEPTAVPRRPLNEPPRLAKRISEMTSCSRRQADEWIENGWVRVDGLLITTLGSRVHPNARIEIREEAARHQTESVTILLNKPLDMQAARDDSESHGSGGSALALIRPENRWAEDDTRLNFKATHLRGLALAGRLDSDATGMLVFTQEGSVARRITGDDARLEKEYMVRVEGELAPDGLKLLNHGLSLDDIKLKRAQVSWQNEQQLRFVLHESRQQQIQRMCELVGLRVAGIKRIRIGSVSLGKLPAGQWRYLREDERF